MIHILDWNFRIGSFRLEQGFLPFSSVRIDFIRIQRKEVRREGYEERERERGKKGRNGKRTFQKWMELRENTRRK